MHVTHVHSHMWEDWMPRAESNWDENAMLKVKVKCVMWNEQIDGLAISHNPTPLLKEKMNARSKC